VGAEMVIRGEESPATDGILVAEFLIFISCYADQVDFSGAATAAPPTPVSSAPVPASRPRRILVVDDSPLMLLAVGIGLERPDRWAVTTTGSGRAAIVIAAQHRPDAVLLDVTMPDLDGPDTLRALRADPATASIPVVFMTAAIADEVRLRALGAAGVIGKPLDLATLGDQLDEALGWLR
jgi:CheY-like chemotaxis protein